uniref:Uncharacterized protein n=1 Tax=Rhizophora mucronata TaxID=61149 RepID=A0A2P2PWK9_RHIMU
MQNLYISTVDISSEFGPTCTQQRQPYLSLCHATRFFQHRIGGRHPSEILAQWTLG